MNSDTLADLGWNADFLRQLDLDEVATTEPARVTGVHRNRLETLTGAGPLDLIPASDMNTGNVAVGDWVLARGGVALRVLDRHSELARKAAGTGVARQLIAANVDTALIVVVLQRRFQRRAAGALSGPVRQCRDRTGAGADQGRHLHRPCRSMSRGRALQRGLAVRRAERPWARCAPRPFTNGAARAGRCCCWARPASARPRFQTP